MPLIHRDCGFEKKKGEEKGKKGSGKGKLIAAF